MIDFGARDTDNLIALVKKFGGKVQLNWCSITLCELSMLINYYIKREYKLDEVAESEGSSICPLCGVDSPHQHTPLEQVIYANGIKRGRAALKEHDAKVLESAAGFCEKIAEERFAENGTTEYDTNATYYEGSSGDEYEIRDEEDIACADAIRRMAEERRKP